MRVLLFILFAISLNAQSLTLSKSQMIADFDSLTYTLFKVSPHIPIKKDLWNLNTSHLLSELKTHIDTIQSDYSFYILIMKALNTCQDFHTSIITNDDEFVNLSNTFEMYLPISYIDGKYYTTHTIIKENDTIPITSQITHFKGIKVDEYIKNNLSERVFNYDMKHRKFYSTSFYKNIDIYHQDSVSIGFKFPNGVSKNYFFKIKEEPKLYHRNRDTISNKVEYWSEHKTLYIKLLEMNSKLLPRMLSKIASHRNNKEIEKVIFDIRENKGGSDHVWKSIYSAIISDTVKFFAQINGYYPTFMSKEYLENHELNPNKMTLDKSDLLKKYNQYTYSSIVDEILPTDTSLFFKGKFYVLGESIYSSAGSALAIPNQNPNDNFISVGRKTNMFLGVGYSPIVFQLPNSKIRFRIAPSMEVTNCAKLKDLMKDNYEIDIPINLQEFIDIEQYIGNTKSKNFMLKFDPFIKAILENQ